MKPSKAIPLAIQNIVQEMEGLEESQELFKCQGHGNLLLLFLHLSVENLQFFGN